MVGIVKDIGLGLTQIALIVKEIIVRDIEEIKNKKLKTKQKLTMETRI